MTENDQTDICCIFDQAAHYRAPIYKLMDQELSCHFYISKWKKDPFEQMNYEELKGLKGVSFNRKLIGNYYWQSSTVRHAFKNYKKVLMSGNLYSVSTWVLLIILRLLKKKAYLWSHGWYGRENKIKTLMKKMFFSLPDKTFVYGLYAKNLMIENGILSHKIECIYNSLDYSVQRKIRDRLHNSNIYIDHFKNRFPVLIYIGRIQKVKKINLLFDAIVELKKRGKEYNLVLIGKEDVDVNILKTLRGDPQNTLENIWMYGECYNENEIGELLYNADICISPGNVGLTAIHSLVYGTPVITHDNKTNQMPEFEAIKKNLSGLFFAENSATDLADKIEEWIQFSRGNRDKIRKNCFEVIDRFYNPLYQIEILKKELL